MINFALIIIAFISGYFLHKKQESIVTFFRSLKFLYSMSKQKDVYNDFFECNFKESDYAERGDIENV